MVAMMFCQSGPDPKIAQLFFPDMTYQKYRSYLVKISGIALRSIESFLRYECNVVVEHLQREFSANLKEKLIKVRDWMPKKDIGQLNTYYSFIERYFNQDKNIEISYSDALPLYKTLIDVGKNQTSGVNELFSEPIRSGPPREERYCPLNTTPV